MNILIFIYLNIYKIIFIYDYNVIILNIMDTKLYSIDKLVSIDNNSLDKEIGEELFIDNLSDQSFSIPINNINISNENKEDSENDININHENNLDCENDINLYSLGNILSDIDINNVIDQLNIQNINSININEDIQIENNVIDMDLINNTTKTDPTDVKIENDIIEINLNSNEGTDKNSNDINNQTDVSLEVSDTYNNLPEINLEMLMRKTESNINHKSLDQELDSKLTNLENNNQKLEEEYSQDINERMIHNHGFIEQETFENKINLDSEFNISKELTLAHNLEFTNSNDDITTIQNLSNHNIEINNLNNDKYLIEGTQFINGTIENSYIFGSTLSNVILEGKIKNINKIDYSNMLFNGKISTVMAGLKIEAYQCVECYVQNSNLYVRPTDPMSSSPFFGIAQNSVIEGGIVEVLTEGISYVNVKNTIELPILKRVTNQIIFASDNKNNVFKQNFNLNIEKDDLLVLTGTLNDILIGPSTKYYQFNNSNINGSLSLYKSIQINFQTVSYALNNTLLLSHNKKKMIKNNEFITVLDVDSSGRVIGLLN